MKGKKECSFILILMLWAVVEGVSCLCGGGGGGGGWLDVWVVYGGVG